MTELFYGKYLGIVVDNDDPKGLARVRATIPEVFGEEPTGWCLPCSPYPGRGTGLAAVPPLDSLIFVEWPAGDTSRVPIWSGGAWPDGEGVADAGPEAIVLRTPAGHRMVIRDSSGSEAIEIEAASGAKIVLDGDGVLVELGSQQLAVSRTSISLNGGALEVR
ncbi:MAG: phage baseplate assembly protein V [Pseudonocardiaceae bacterium]